MQYCPICGRQPIRAHRVCQLPEWDSTDAGIGCPPTDANCTSKLCDPSPRSPPLCPGPSLHFSAGWCDSLGPCRSLCTRVLN
ncbi:hypothetical protein COCON_G00188390 [Conger conger]|uniref:Uncharacterized protein n=1 Tax=Conger conger TaxID=82655 RepID=A0A9Q1D351_CONCO|nr:hypothetical protein COCON_G00188390 [Conger conger]